MNPYKVLNLDQDATKPEIVRAVTLAMKERKYPSKEIMLAQQRLMEPISRAAQNFLWFIDVTPFLKAQLEQFDAQESEMPSVSDDDLAYLAVWENS